MADHGLSGSDQRDTLSGRQRATANAKTLEGELDWLSLVLHSRVRQYFQPGEASLQDFRPPELKPDESEYAALLFRLKATHEERLIILLALTPQLRPHLLDVFFTQNSSHPRSLSDFGGFHHTQHGGFTPTVETAIFLIAGTDLARRFEVMACFRDEHFFFRTHILPLEVAMKGEAQPRTPISVTDEFWQMITAGVASQSLNTQTPSRRITTQQEWKDLIGDEKMMESLLDIRLWIEHGNTLLQGWGLGKLIRPGYPCFFYGPQGTGKKFAAALLGKTTGRDVCWVDLSQMLSLPPLESEKKIAGVFSQAASLEWIIFLDGADAWLDTSLSGPGSSTGIYSREFRQLMQQIEDFPGVVILASNLQNFYDETFTRRFQSIVQFYTPDADQRLALWKSFFSGKLKISPEVNLEQIAGEYILKPASMINVIRYCALAAIRRNDEYATTADILSGIHRELMKEARPVEA